MFEVSFGKLFAKHYANFPAKDQDKIDAFIEHYQEHGAPKGEIVLVIEPPRPVQHSDDDLRVMLTAALEDMGTKAAAAIVAEQTGVSKKDLYAMALELKRDGER